MLWSKEVEVAKSVDDFVTWQSIEGRDFPEFEMLDAKIASGRQIAQMIYDHFRATGAHDAALSTCQIFSFFPYKEMTFRISIQEGTKL